MKNKYFIMRHGESEANLQKIIIATPENGVPYYGLSSKGKDEVLNSIKEDRSGLDSETLIYSSDFKRARETAEIVCQYLGGQPIILKEELRERNFGTLEKKSNENYQLVWDEDINEQGINTYGSESVSDVLKRAKSIVEYCEQSYENKKILFVSHGDTLQILMTYFLGINPQKHRSIKHLNTAEIRELILK